MRLNPNFKELFCNMFYKVWLTVMPLACGFYYGITGQFVFLLVGLIPLILTINIEEEMGGIKLDRFVIENGKSKRRKK